MAIIKKYHRKVFPPRPTPDRSQMLFAVPFVVLGSSEEKPRRRNLKEINN